MRDVVRSSCRYKIVKVDPHPSIETSPTRESYRVKPAGGGEGAMVLENNNSGIPVGCTRRHP